MKEDVYSYLGKKSKNSIVGNVIRNKLNLLGLRGTNLPQKKLSVKEAEKFVEDRGSTRNSAFKWGSMGKVRYTPDSEKGAKYSFSVTNDVSKSTTPKDYVGMTKVSSDREHRTANTLSHELGHDRALRDPKSFNFKQEKLRDKNKKLKPLYPGVPRTSPEYKMMEIRAEREAWAEGRRLKGTPETPAEKLNRKFALGTYERALESEEQVENFMEDPKYREYMLKRTGKKILGTSVGLALGLLGAKYLNKKDNERLNLLLKKLEINPNDSLVLKEIKTLRRKIRLKRLALGTGGAVGGYLVTKKYLT